MACPKCGCKTTYQYDSGDDCGQSDDRLERCAACAEVFDIEDHADEEEDEIYGDGVAAVTVLHPAPEPHHAECAAGCSGALKWMAGPCRQQCTKTPEFQVQCARDAEASRLRFRTSVGANVLREVAAAGSAVDGVPGTYNDQREMQR